MFLIISRGAKPCLRNGLGLADPASSVHLDPGIGRVPIRYVPCARGFLSPRNCLWRDLDNDTNHIDIFVINVVIQCTNIFPA